MRDYIYCCGFEQDCKRYDLPAGKKAWKRLYFIDECGICGRPVAALFECALNGSVKLLKRCSGSKALALREKLAFAAHNFKLFNKGTLQKERTFYNDRGVIYNFNNRIVAYNDEWCGNVSRENNM